ncbi:unnamed protein product [Amoebophrya sp. A120]|nr:unnamed protein product [Amoebophrya sp. A120]|eukprot:GSA120T00020591001.1
MREEAAEKNSRSSSIVATTCVRGFFLLWFLLLSFHYWQALRTEWFVPKVILCAHWAAMETGIRIGFEKCGRKALGTYSVMATSFRRMEISTYRPVSLRLNEKTFSVHDHNHAFFAPRRGGGAALFTLTEIGAPQLRRWFGAEMEKERFHRLEKPEALRKLIDYELARRGTRNGRQRLLRTKRVDEQSSLDFLVPQDARVVAQRTSTSDKEAHQKTSASTAPSTCSVFSFGINYQFEFDDYYLFREKCNVFSFDPSMDQRRHAEYVHHPQRHVFEFLALGSRDGFHDNTNAVSTLYKRPELQPLVIKKAGSAATPGDGNKNKGTSTTTSFVVAQDISRGFEERRVSTLMTQKKLDHLDVLRFDVEGAEWGVLDEVQQTIPKIGTLSAEFHFFYGARNLTKFFSLLCDPDQIQTAGEPSPCFDLGTWVHGGGCGYPCLEITAAHSR